MTSPVRRHIRPVRIVPYEEVEDQLWPVNLLVVILAGFVVGLILGLSRFDDPRLFYNAYFQLLTVGLTLAGWFIATVWLRGRLKQRIKIAALFSLVVHVWLLLSLGVGYYRLIVQEKSGPDNVEKLAELTVPDYPESIMERGEIPREYRQPVETPLPQPQVAPPSKHPQPEPPSVVEKPSVPAPKQAEVHPLPLLQRREVSPPHRAEMSGEQIRRQMTEVRQEPPRPLPLPEIRPSAPPKGPSAPEELVQRQASQPPQPAPAKPSPPVPEPSRPSPAVPARQPMASSQDLPPFHPPSPDRALRSAPAPTMQVESPAPQAAPQQERPSAYRPRALAIERFQSLPVDRKPTSQVPSPTPQPPQKTSIVQRAEPSPTIAQTPNPTPPRQSPQTLQATLPEEPLPQAAVAQQAQTPLAPAQAKVARQDPTLGHLADRPPPVETPPMVSQSVGPTALAPSRRPEASALASGQLQAGPPDRTAPRSLSVPRFEAAAGVQPQPTAPVAPSVPQTTQADNISLPEQARSSAVPGRRPAQALSGDFHPVTGVGLSQPVAAARQAQASQQGLQGDLEPIQTVAPLPRRPSGTPIPSAPAVHEEASLAGSVGSAQSSAGDQVRLWEAGSQTPLVRQSPGAPVGQASARTSALSPTASLGPGGVVATGAAKPAEEGGLALPIGQHTELGRSRTGADRLAGLEGTAPQTTPGPMHPGGAAATGSETGSAQHLGPFQPGAVAVGKTAPTGGLPGTHTTGKVAWEIPTGGGPTALASLRRSGGGRDQASDGFQEPGISGPTRQMGRWPSDGLAANVPEIGASATAGGSPEKGPPSSPMPSGRSPEPALPGGERSGPALPDSVALGPSGAGGRVPGNGSVTATPGAVGTAVVGSGKGHSSQKEASQQGLDHALAGLGIPRSVRMELPGTEAEGASDHPGSAGQASSGLQTGTAQGKTESLGGETVEVGRQAGGVPVSIAAPRGVGGISELLSPYGGVPTRRASPHSEEIHLATPGRFLLERSSSRWGFDGRAAPAEAFRQRHPTRRAQEAQKYGGSEASEKAVERGLAFLAKLQWPDGRWRLHAIPDSLETWPGESQARQQPELLIKMAHSVGQAPLGPDPAQQVHQRRAALQRLLAQHASKGLDSNDWAELHRLVREAVFLPGRQESDSAATGLALLAFLGAGYTHLEGPYRTQVQRGLEWLLANQKPDGDLWGHVQGSPNTWLYSHAMAAIALCEAYGMTRDPALRSPAERAIAFIVAAQHPTRGGWRYQPREGSDTSVSGWQLMALKSAQMAGLEVPQTTLDLVSRWLDLAKAPGNDGSRYVYNPLASSSDPPFWRQPTLAMTAEALLMRMYLGWNRTHPLLQQGALFLQANLPEDGTPDRPTRDAYYWYYATQVMFQMADSYWETWNHRLRPYLESTQLQQGPLTGSWDPLQPVPDRFAHDGGRFYVTTMHLLMLEVYYRHLPLFKTLREENND